MKVLREKKHRLPSEYYHGRQVVSFTLCIKEHKPIFTSPEIVRYVGQCLCEEAQKHHCEILAYVFMPDHSHILLEGTTDDSDVVDVISRFKQKIGYWFSKQHPHVHWQKDFHDHIIRNEKDIRMHIDYILANPVRKNLVEDWKEYPFKGSTVYNFAEW